MYSFEFKFARAIQHLYDLFARIDKLKEEGHAYSITQDFDSDTGEYVIYVEPRELPGWVGPRIGDFLFSMRSGLDHLAYELALAHTGAPLPDDIAEHSEFPIFGEREMTARERERKIGGIAPHAQAVIERLQPHNRGDQYITDPLWMLNELSNIDKHRTPHLTYFISRGVAINGPLAFESVFIPNIVGPLVGKTELMRYHGEGLSEPDMDMYLDFKLEIALDQRPPTYGHPLGAVLFDIYRYVGTVVVEELSGFLPEQVTVLGINKTLLPDWFGRVLAQESPPVSGSA